MRIDCSTGRCANQYVFFVDHVLANALRAIVAGWKFQLCADVTGNFCNISVDLLEFSVTSIPCQNNVLCLSIIPKATVTETIL